MVRVASHESRVRDKSMNENDVLQLINQGEGQRLECKRSLAELNTATRTVFTFANTDGGILPQEI